jgi:hypothetical protein
MVRISPAIPTILTESFNFFCLSRCMVGYYLKIGHDILLTNPYILTIHDYIPILFKVK